MKTLVLGMGNTLLADDGVGIYIARELSRRLQGREVNVKETQLAGFYLAELLEGYERAIIVDSVRTGRCAPGTLQWFTLDELGQPTSFLSAHHIGLRSALDLAGRMGIPVPQLIEVLTVEVADTGTFAEQCTTAAVREAIPRAVEQVLSRLS
ncbi:MAG: hydrogenase maturation protease [bacterium]|jgi:hydrogenase maturation protease|nr:hydrogenase maturation protease [candidate division KSB1 bacterium]MDH7558620.1 hydrogenase maturation protease [bacterium]